MPPTTIPIGPTGITPIVAPVPAPLAAPIAAPFNTLYKLVTLTPPLIYDQIKYFVISMSTYGILNIIFSLVIVLK